MPKRLPDPDPEIEKAAKAMKYEFEKFKQGEEHAEAQEGIQKWVGKRANERKVESTEGAQKGIKLHEDLKAKTEEVIKTAQSGFETFASAMSSILELSTRLAEVLHQNIVCKVLDGVKEKAMPVVDTVGAKIASWVKEKFTGGQFDLPKLKHNVHFKDGGFDVDDVTAGLPGLSGDTRTAVNDAFKHGIKLWLQRCNYEQVPGNPAQYRDKDSKAPLTKEKFNALKDNGDLSLDRFLGGQFEMGVEETARPTSP